MTFALGDSSSPHGGLASRRRPRAKGDRPSSALENSVDAEIVPDSENDYLTVIEDVAPTAWSRAEPGGPRRRPGQAVT